MPRVVQPGGKSGKIRVRYPARRKLAIISAVRRIMDEMKSSLREASSTIPIHHTLVAKWAKESAILLDAIKSKKKSRHPGPDGQLRPIEDDLLRFIFKLREMGMPVNMLMVVIKASTLHESKVLGGLAVRQTSLTDLPHGNTRISAPSG